MFVNKIVFKCVAVLTLASALVFASVTLASHPDGRAVTYRGFGPTTFGPTSYSCALYGSNGGLVGDISFAYVGGQVDLHVQGKEAHFLGSGGITTFHPLDPTTFPDLAMVPEAFKAAGNGIMLFTVRGEIGVNSSLVEPITAFAQSFSVVEVRCTYIVDSQGFPIFCLNCLYVTS